MTSSSVELSVAAFALIKGMVRVVQAAMLGAILNNLLLVSICVPCYFRCWASRLPFFLTLYVLDFSFVNR